MKITMIEVDATAEDLKASITDAFLGFGETVSVDDETAEEGSET